MGWSVVACIQRITGKVNNVQVNSARLTFVTDRSREVLGEDEVVDFDVMFGPTAPCYTKLYGYRVSWLLTLETWSCK